AEKPAPAPAQPPVTPAGHGRRGRAGHRVLALGGLAAVVLAGALTAGTVPRLRQEREVNAAAAEAANPRQRVTGATARGAAPEAERVLPGNAQPLLDAGLFARTTGYLKTRLVDIRDRVREGQLLAVIDAPDLDDQLTQAKANLEQARAT